MEKQLVRQFRWADHQPVLFTCINKFPHNKIVEFGAGYFSTELLYNNYIDSFVSVEEDTEWFSRIKESLKDKPGFKMIHNTNTCGCGRSTCFKDLNLEQIKFFDYYYKRLAESYKDIDLLFVDNYAATRCFIIKHLYQGCKVVVWHDSQEPEGYHGYKAMINSMDVSNYVHFSYRTLTHFSAPATDILIRKDVLIDEEGFIEELKKQERIYLTKFGKKNFNKFDLRRKTSDD